MFSLFSLLMMYFVLLQNEEIYFVVLLTDSWSKLLFRFRSGHVLSRRLLRLHSCQNPEKKINTPFRCPVLLKEPVSPKVLCAPRYIFHIWKIRHFLDCREVWFVSSSIAAVSDPKALVWILTWHLSVAVSISLYISEFWSVFVVEKEIFKLDAS